MKLPDCVWRAAFVLLVATWAGLGGAASPAGEGPAGPAVLELRAGDDELDLWPAVRVRHDKASSLTLDEVLAAPKAFHAPEGATAALGVAEGTVWLRALLHTGAGAGGDWVFDLDYAPLQRLEIALLRDGKLVRTAVRGALEPRARHQGRTHALMMQLDSDARYELVLRVQTQGALILPMRISRPATFHARELAEQMLQGLLLGLGASLVLYSLIQWAVVRERLFGQYALMSGGSVLFSVVHFGIGAQFLWPGSAWLEGHAGGLAALAATVGSFLFIAEALDPGRRKPRWSGVMMLGATLTGVVALLFATDLMDVPTLAAVQSVLGLVPVLMGIPVATHRARQGDRVGATFLLAWLVYFVSTATIIGVIHGQLPVSFWTMHAFQFAATVDLLLFMHVLGLRLKAAQHEARQAHREREALYSLAHSDPLTGLRNRRGLDAALAQHLPHASDERLVAVYVLDLDGFKAVNDAHGHDAGDQLLVYAGQRLQHCLRESDHVVRLGGDEFVVVAANLADERQAADIGMQLLHRFERPFKLDELRCGVGATIGYALAPLDGRDADTLMQLADQAMYEGKQAGKRVLVRASPPAAGPAPGAPGASAAQAAAAGR